MKIQNRLIVSITCIVAVVVIFSSYLSLNLFKSMVLSIEKKNFSSMLKVFAYSCKLDVDKFVEVLADDKEVLYAMVLLKSGEVVVHSEKELVGKILDDPVSREAIKSNSLHFADIVWKGKKGIDAAMPIELEKVRWGMVRIGFSTQHIEDDIQRARNYITLLASLALLFGVVLAFALSRNIVSPILKLTDKAEQIAMGKRDVDFDFPIIVEQECKKLLESRRAKGLPDRSSGVKSCWEQLNPGDNYEGQTLTERFLECSDCPVFKKYMLNELNRLVETFKIMYESIMQKETALKEDEIKIKRSNVLTQRALKKLLDSETKYKTLADSARDIIFTIDLDGRFDYISKKADEILHIDSAKELVGQSYTKILTHESRKVGFETFKKIRSGEETTAFEVKAVSSDNKFIPLELILSPITEDGELVGVHGIARDISYRKSLEAQLIQTGRLSSIGELATGIAHELNQPLMIIKGYSQLINSDLTEDDRYYNELRLLEKHATRMSRIINHLQAFARQDAPCFSRVNINEIIENSLIMVSEHLKTNNIEVVKKFKDAIAPTYGDPSQLEQVIINLITNARDAMAEKGGGVLEFKTSDSEDGESIIVKVTDTGIGIPAERLESIFDPFFTTKEVGKGTGLGLSISYGIIQSHEGVITAASEVGNGTTFTIILPIMKES